MSNPPARDLKGLDSSKTDMHPRKRLAETGDRQHAKRIKFLDKDVSPPPPPGVSVPTDNSGKAKRRASSVYPEPSERPNKRAALDHESRGGFFVTRSSLSSIRTTLPAQGSSRGPALRTARGLDTDLAVLKTTPAQKEKLHGHYQALEESIEILKNGIQMCQDALARLQESQDALRDGLREAREGFSD